MHPRSSFKASRWRGRLGMRTLWIAGLVAWHSLVSGDPRALGEAAGEKAIEVGAYYYPWYHSDRRHWELGYDGQDWKDGQGKGRGPVLGEYSSRSAETIRRHFEWSGEFGVDFWICSWWGPGSWEDETLLRHVLPEWERAAEEGREPPRLCLFYESEGLLGLDPEAGIVFDAAKSEAFAEHFRWIAEHYFEHPAYRRSAGRPVVYLYLSRTFSGEHLRALARARAVASARGFELHLVGDEVYWGEPDLERVRALDAITAYNLHGPPRFAGQEDWGGFIDACDALYRRWRELAAAEGVGFVPGAMPGFSTEDAAPGLHYTIPRRIRPGAGAHSTFEAMLALARRHLDPGRRELAVTSFNEWHEGTQIEPGPIPGAGEVLRSVPRSVEEPPFDARP